MSRKSASLPKAILFLPILALAYTFAYSRLVVLPLSELVFWQNKIVDAPLAMNKIPLDITKQKYFLTIKHERVNSSKNIYLNGSLLKPLPTRSKRAIQRANIIIPPELIRPDSNLLEVAFSAGLPRDVDIRLGNFRKKISDEMFIFFKENVLLRRPHIVRILFVFLAAQILILVLMLGLFKASGRRYFILVQLLPLTYFLLMAILPLLFGYRILISRFLFFLMAGIFLLPGIVFLCAKIWSNRMVLVLGRNRAILNCFACFISLAVFFILAEGITRLYVRHFKYNAIFTHADTDMELLYRLKPDASETFADTVVHCNNLGLRNPEIPLKKSVSTKRIVCLGDSITFGFGVDGDKPYPAILNKLLEEEPAGHYEVINCGVPGYNMYQERLFLERYILKLQPDIVIIGLCLNDIGGGVALPYYVTSRFLGPIYNGHTYRLYRFKDMPVGCKIQLWVAKHSYFAQYLFLKANAFLSRLRIFQRPMVGDYLQESIDSYRGAHYLHLERAKQIFEEEILRIQEMLSRSNTPLIMAVFPNDIQLTDKSLRAPQVYLADFCKKHNIYFLDLLPEYEAYDRKKILVDIGHSSPFGHQLAAKKIESLLKGEILNKGFPE